MKDIRETRFKAWHERAFSSTVLTIPHEVLRDYLDYQTELRMADQGKMPYLADLSISEIKERGARIYQKEN